MFNKTIDSVSSDTRPRIGWSPTDNSRAPSIEVGQNVKVSEAPHQPISFNFPGHLENKLEFVFGGWFQQHHLALAD